jgi:dTDP-4-dehydrorhamnose 3,5-epimerase
VRCLRSAEGRLIHDLKIRRLLVKLPQGLHHGWKRVGEAAALILNVPDQVYGYDASDEHRVDPHENDIPYDWGRRDG